VSEFRVLRVFWTLESGGDVLPGENVFEGAGEEGDLAIAEVDVPVDVVFEDECGFVWLA
jgi:hypothetical protein